jgi:thiamine kinase-like enzyme
MGKYSEVLNVLSYRYPRLDIKRYRIVSQKISGITIAAKEVVVKLFLNKVLYELELRYNEMLGKDVPVPKILYSGKTGEVYHIIYDKIREPISYKMRRFLKTERFLKNYAGLVAGIHASTLRPIADVPELNSTKTSFNVDAKLNENDREELILQIGESSLSGSKKVKFKDRELQLSNIKVQKVVKYKNVHEMLSAHLKKMKTLCTDEGLEDACKRIIAMIKNNEEYFSEEEVSLVHGDLHDKNLIFNRRLYITDLEACRWFDPYYDLCSVYNNLYFRKKNLNVFLEYYCRARSIKISRKRLKLMLLIYYLDHAVFSEKKKDKIRSRRLLTKYL